MQHVLLVCIKLVGYAIAMLYLRQEPLPALALGIAGGGLSGLVAAKWPVPPSTDDDAQWYRARSLSLAAWRRILAGVILAAVILGAVMVQQVPAIRGVTVYFTAYIVALTVVAALTSRKSFEAAEEARKAALARMVPKGTVPIAPPSRAPTKISLADVLLTLAMLAMFAMPFVQYYAFIAYGTLRAFLLPLAAFIALLMANGLVLPRRAPGSSPDHARVWRYMAVFAAGLAGAFALPPNGFILAVRETLVDCLAVLTAAYLIRLRNSRPLSSSTGRHSTQS